MYITDVILQQYHFINYVSNFIDIIYVTAQWDRIYWYWSRDFKRFIALEN